jgi:tRNA threonylcarbamoyladenosine modification (KEOPS) complex  Pcc1 subunit
MKKDINKVIITVHIEDSLNLESIIESILLTLQIQL